RGREEERGGGLHGPIVAGDGVVRYISGSCSPMARLGLLGISLLAVAGCHKRTECEREFVEMGRVVKVLERFHSQAGRYPRSWSELVRSKDNPEGLIEEAPKDRWGRPYLYQAPTANGIHPVITTYGADGAPGGSGDDADFDSTAYTWP